MYRFTFLISFLIFSTLSAQKFEIKGIVLNGQTHEPLAFANIYNPETNSGTSTKEDGSFTLKVPSGSDIYISFIGFKTEIIKSDYFRGSSKTILLTPVDILMQEVSVYSGSAFSLKEVSRGNLSLQKEKIEKVSSGIPDVLRSIQAFPGISANNGFQAEFNVRGGNKDENLIQVNGSEIYEPYHIKAVPNASLGIFNVDLIQKVNVITGGFTAQYGDRLSSVANIFYREGNKEKIKGSANLNMAFVESSVEGPLLKNGSFIFGFRKTYMEYLLDMFKFDDENINSVNPSFYDAQGLLSYNVSPKSKFKLIFIHSTDFFKYQPENIEKSLFYESEFNGRSALFSERTKKTESSLGKYYSSFIDLQNLTFLNNSAFLQTSISYYDQLNSEKKFSERSFSRIIESDNNYFEKENKTESFIQNLVVKTLELKSTLDYQITPFWETRVGGGYKRLIYNQNISLKKELNNSTNTKNYPDTTFYTGQQGGQYAGNEALNAASYKNYAFIENIYQIHKNLIFNIGGRIDYFDLNRDLTVSPRINIAYSPAPGTILRAAWGHYYQSPLYSQLRYSQASDSNTQSQKAIHYILGYEQNIDLSESDMSVLTVKVDVFYKDYKNLISSYKSHFDRIYYSLLNDAEGFAKGIDVYLLLSLPRFYTWISYEYLISRENNLNDNFGSYPRNSSQLHTLAWVLNLNLGKNWEITSRFYYGSGYPYTPKTPVYNENQLRWAWKTESKNSAYLPSYKRVDIRISKKIILSKNYDLFTFIDLNNAFNFKNVSGYDYNFDSEGKPKINKVILWPFFPSFGIKLLF